MHDFTSLLQALLDDFQLHSSIRPICTILRRLGKVFNEACPTITHSVTGKLLFGYNPEDNQYVRMLLIYCALADNNEPSKHCNMFMGF
jgi:hypothetical protein